jgi:hypothetical protein
VYFWGFDDLKNSQLLIIAAVIFGILGISLISFEVSTGFASIQIVQLALTVVVLIFTVGIFAGFRKRITRNEAEPSSSDMKRSDRQLTNELLTETTEQTSPKNYWWFFVIGAFGDLLAGVWVFSITEGKANNWIFLMVFVVAACLMLGLAGWVRSWRQK